MKGDSAVLEEVVDVCLVSGVVAAAAADDDNDDDTDGVSRRVVSDWSSPETCC